MRVERKLSAILAADVAGYSRLMHNDEEAPMQSWRRSWLTLSTQQSQRTAVAS